MVCGKERFVVASIPNTAPTLFVKENWKEPFVNFIGLASVVGNGTGTLMLTMLLMLGMPLTNNVANA